MSIKIKWNHMKSHQGISTVSSAGIYLNYLLKLQKLGLETPCVSSLLMLLFLRSTPFGSVSSHGL